MICQDPNKTQNDLIFHIIFGAKSEEKLASEKLSERLIKVMKLIENAFLKNDWFLVAEELAKKYSPRDFMGQFNLILLK